MMIDNVKVIGTGPNHTLTVTSSPLNGVAVGVSPADINSALRSGTTSFTRSYLEGTIVNLSAPSAPADSVFVKWKKNGADFSSNPNTSVTIDASMTLTAIYAIGTAPVADNDSYSATRVRLGCGRTWRARRRYRRRIRPAHGGAA